MPTLQEFKADFFRALAHPIRIRILETLSSGEQSVHELQQQLDLDCVGVVPVDRSAFGEREMCVIPVVRVHVDERHRRG